MNLRLIALDCPACGSAMRGDSSDLIFFCSHCGSAALLGNDALQPVPSSALLPARGHHAQIWRPAWVLEAAVVVADRRPAGGGRIGGWRGDRTFVVPAFALPLPELVLLGQRLSEVARSVGEVPREPIRGGSLAFEDALTLVRHLVVGDEVRKHDKLTSVEISIVEKSHRLAAIPFEDARDGRLRCAITDTVVRPVTD